MSATTTAPADPYHATCPWCRAVVVLALRRASDQVAPTWDGTCVGCGRWLRLLAAKDGGTAVVPRRGGPS